MQDAKKSAEKEAPPVKASAKASAKTPAQSVEKAAVAVTKPEPAIKGAELVIGADETNLQKLIETTPLKRPFYRISVENLNPRIGQVGDVQIRYNGRVVWVIERKRIDDLVSAMSGADFRWIRQPAQMTVFATLVGARQLYIFEDYVDELADAHGEFNQMPVQTIRAAIAGKIGRDLVVPWRTKNLKETAQFLMDLAWIVDEHGFGSNEPPPRGSAFDYIPIDKTESLTPENVCRLMLAQVPGVGRAKATSIAQHFRGSFSDFFRFLDRIPSQHERVRALATIQPRIEGVSVKIATQIVHALFGPRDVSPTTVQPPPKLPKTPKTPKAPAAPKQAKAPAAPKTAPAKKRAAATSPERAEPTTAEDETTPPTMPRPTVAPGAPKRRRLTKATRGQRSLIFDTDDDDDDFSGPALTTTTTTTFTASLSTTAPVVAPAVVDDDVIVLFDDDDDEEAFEVSFNDGNDGDEAVEDDDEISLL